MKTNNFGRRAALPKYRIVSSEHHDPSRNYLFGDHKTTADRLRKHIGVDDKTLIVDLTDVFDDYKTAADRLSKLERVIIFSVSVFSGIVLAAFLGGFALAQIEHWVKLNA